MRAKRGPLNLPILTGVIFLHAGALLAPFTFNWPAFWVFLVLWWMTNGLGITLCYHRLLCHRSFQCPKILEYFFAVCGALTSQGGPISWASTHRCHHANSDTDEDPHSPVHGFWWSHMFWFMHQLPEVGTKEFAIRYAPDLYKDRFYRLLDRYEWILQWVLGLFLLWWGGLSFVIWGIFLRTVVALHCTWLVNSAGHRWGYQTFKTGEYSRNLWWVGLLAFGEGWHNNHHAFQSSAAHGLKWWEFDITYLTIKLLSRLGLAWDIRMPSAQAIQAKS